MFILELYIYDPSTANFGDLDNGIYETRTIACADRAQTLENYWNERKNLPKYVNVVIDYEIKKIVKVVD